MNKSKWFAYTVMVALIPMVSRLLVWTTLANQSIEPIAATDVVAFGLVLNISVINEIEHVQGNDAWKTIQNGVAICFIALYSVLFAVVLVGEKNSQIVNMKAMLMCVAGMAGVSLILSLSVLHRLSVLARPR